MSLTDAEHEAMRLTAELWTHLNEIVGTGPSRTWDLDELAIHIHGIQRAILSQSGARAHPGLYRLLGEEIA